MHFLEGFSYDEPWPKVLGKFVLLGGLAPRDPSLPDNAIIEWGR
jgi:hypothetical protein